MRINSQPETFLKHFVDWAATRPDVAAVVLVGSHARRAATPDSDVDLVILCSCADGLLRADWPDLFGDVTSSSIEEFGALRSRRISYRDGLEVEFGIAERLWARVPLDPGTARVLRDGVRILYDPEELLARAIAELNGSTNG